MSRVLITEIGGKEYKFALDRKEIIRAEARGFSAKEIENAPTTQMSFLWEAGLHKFQPNLKLDEALGLMDTYAEEDGDVQEVIEFLSTEYAAFLQATPKNSKKLKKARVESV